uniref:Uncharacterized protein n=1 Tax=Anopheles funestus TaxID=62324 RepID=A0A4Y0BQA6_ANOFN
MFEVTTKLIVIAFIFNFTVAHRGGDHGDRDDSNDSDGDRGWDRGSPYWNNYPATVVALPGFTTIRNTAITVPPFPVNTGFDIRTG